MDEIKKLITLINSDKLFDAKTQLNKVSLDKIKAYKDEITKNIEIFNKK